MQSGWKGWASGLDERSKVDRTTLMASRGKFVRVCAEIDLTKPLKEG